MDGKRPLPSPDSPDDLGSLEDEARSFAEGSKAAATRKAYASGWSDFVAFCRRLKRRPLPATAETVSLYLAHGARRLKTSTLEQRLVAIAHYHLGSGFENPMTDPAVRVVWDGIRRELGTAKRRKNPALTKLVRRLVAALPETTLGLRDKALLLLGFAGAMRRSEIVSLDVSDLELVEEGLIVTLRRTKTDQIGRGRQIGIPLGSNEKTCPVRAIKAWLSVSGIHAGPLFRSVNRHGQVQPSRLSDQTVATVVKRTVLSIGLDPRNFAGHSLRSGFATMAAIEGASERDIQKQTGHKNLLVLRRYIHDGQLFQNSAAKKLGL